MFIVKVGNKVLPSQVVTAPKWSDEYNKTHRPKIIVTNGKPSIVLVPKADNQPISEPVILPLPLPAEENLLAQIPEEPASDGLSAEEQAELDLLMAQTRPKATVTTVNTVTSIKTTKQKINKSDTGTDKIKNETIKIDTINNNQSKWLEGFTNKIKAILPDYDLSCSKYRSDFTAKDSTQKFRVTVVTVDEVSFSLLVMARPMGSEKMAPCITLDYLSINKLDNYAIEILKTTLNTI